MHAEVDNVWIESPIMSRDHATITMGRSPAIPLLLRDSGSTHGTFLEDSKIDARTDYTLKNLDKLVFGVPVTSGQRMFIICSFPYSGLTAATETFQPKTFMVELDYEVNP